jgi:hypothetical protein
MPSPVLYAGACRCRFNYAGACCSRSPPHCWLWVRKNSMQRTSKCFWRVPVDKMAIRVSVRTQCGSERQQEEWAEHVPAVRRPACRYCSCRTFRSSVHYYLEPMPSQLGKLTEPSQLGKLTLLASVDALSNSSLQHVRWQPTSVDESPSNKEGKS